MLYIYLANTGGAYEEIGRTEDISDNNNPDWPERFLVTYNGGYTQVLVRLSTYYILSIIYELDYTQAWRRRYLKVCFKLFRK